LSTSQSPLLEELPEIQSPEVTGSDPGIGCNVAGSTR
jgi:hypothetical protein